MQNISIQDLSYSIAKLDKAIVSFDNAIDSYDGIDDVHRDGILQRFEYCVELSGKTIKSYIDYEGIEYDIASPRNIIKIAHKIKLIDDVEVRMDFLGSRNKLSHIYSEPENDKIFEFVQEYQYLFSDLQNKLHKIISQGNDEKM